MNRITSIIVTLLITIICVIGWPIGTADATEHELESMHIQVQLHENGDATVVEHRRAFLTDGTENYLPIENLGKSKIENFIVKENGIIYDFVESWDMSATQQEKTYKNGVIETPAGYELIWGIGSYGAHEYMIQYTVTNMI